MSSALTRLQAALLACSVAAAVSILGFAVYAAGSHRWLWGEVLHVRASFRDARGAQPGTRVRILGKESGEVESVELPTEPSGLVTLLLRLDGRTRNLIRSDAVVRIVPDGMVGGKVVEITPGSDGATPVTEGGALATQPTPDLGELMAQIDQRLHDLGQSQGAIGKLIREDEAYQELLRLLRQGRTTMTALQHDADAIKGLPVVRSYVNDPYQELVRPDSPQERQSFRVSDLFESGGAVLSADGRQRLDALAGWLGGFKTKGSEIVVVGYADPAADWNYGHALAQRQGEAVRTYLTDRHGVHKIGWFSRRRVTAVACGANETFLAQKDGLPVPRVDVVVFLPPPSG